MLWLFLVPVAPRLLAITTGEWQIIGVFGGVLVTATVTFLTARRHSSGTITTSAAADLWAESNAMRREYREENALLRERLAVAEAKVLTVEEQNRALRERVAVLEAELDARHG